MRTDTFRHRPALPAVALLLALAATPSHAVFPTPSAFDITGPGGFAAACAALNTGGSSAPHVQITSGLVEASSTCTAQVFTGSGVAATPVTTWPSVQAEGRASAAMGWVSLDASINRDFGVGSFPNGRANGGWADQVVLDMPNMQGQPGVWLMQLHVSGTVKATGPAGAALFDLIPLRNKQGSGNGTLGFNSGTAQVNGDQWLVWRVSSFPDIGFEQETNVIDETVTLTMPIVFGQPFEFGVWGRVVAGTRNSAWASNSFADFGNTLTWAGTAGVVVNGQIVTQGFSISSASGIDWMQATVVPEPGSSALLALGLGAIAWRLRRR